MITATLDKQLMVTVDNKVGTLADIADIIASKGINLIAICAYAVDNKGFIMLVSEDNKNAQRLLEAEGFAVREEDVVIATLDNKPGQLRKMCDAIANAGIDLTLLYGSVEKEGQTSNLILVSEDNRTVLTVVRMMK